MKDLENQRKSKATIVYERPRKRDIIKKFLGFKVEEPCNEEFEAFKSYGQAQIIEDECAIIEPETNFLDKIEEFVD